MSRITEEMTKEQRSIYNHCYRLAKKHFIAIGDIPSDAPKYSYVIHHKDDTLKYRDFQRYIEWHIEDLEVISFGEHSRLHNTGSTSHKNYKLSEETCQKMSKAQMGHSVSEETRKKISESRKGKHWKLVDGKRVYY